MPNHTESSEAHNQALIDAVRALSADDKRRVWEILSTEFDKSSVEGAFPSPTLREAQPEYLASNQGRVSSTLPAPENLVWISFQTPSRLANDLRAVVAWTSSTALV